MSNKILIVDDAKFARNIVIKTLNAGGYTNIIEASTAAEALDCFTQVKPDLTLLDVTLPDNSDLTLLKKLLAASPESKIVMVSAIGQDLIIADALAAGALDFITKPFRKEEFLSVVNNALGGCA